jgi:hypothetical protein
MSRNGEVVGGARARPVVQFRVEDVELLGIGADLILGQPGPPSSDSVRIGTNFSPWQAEQTSV